MIAIVMGELPGLSSFAQMVILMTVVPFGLLLAPQTIRRDKRTLVGVLTLGALAIGVPAYAVVCNICAVCNGPGWWLILECYFV